MVHFCGMLEIVVDLKLKTTSVQTANVKVSWKTDFKICLTTLGIGLRFDNKSVCYLFFL